MIGIVIVSHSNIAKRIYGSYRTYCRKAGKSLCCFNFPQDDMEHKEMKFWIVLNGHNLVKV